MAIRTTAEKGSSLARARMAAHRALDVYWRFGALTRSGAYARLAELMGLPAADCHIGMFDEAQCREVVRLCEDPSFTQKSPEHRPDAG